MTGFIGAENGANMRIAVLTALCCCVVPCCAVLAVLAVLIPVHGRVSAVVRGPDHPRVGQADLQPAVPVHLPQGARGAGRLHEVCGGPHTRTPHGEGSADPFAVAAVGGMWVQYFVRSCRSWRGQGFYAVQSRWNSHQSSKIATSCGRVRKIRCSLAPALLATGSGKLVFKDASTSNDGMVWITH